jgi:hypothetical protein
MLGWLGKMFLSTTERCLWLVWIGVAWFVGIAVSGSIFGADVAVLVVLGLIPGFLIAKAGDGHLGDGLAKRVRAMAVFRLRSPLITIGILAAFGLSAWLASPTALPILGNAVFETLRGIFAIVVLLVVIGVAIAMMTSGPTHPSVPARPAARTAFPEPVPLRPTSVAAAPAVQPQIRGNSMYQAKLGGHSNALSAIVEALKWWAQIPETLPADQQPKSIADIVLWVNRQWRTSIEFVGESYGYIFKFQSENDWITLQNVANKANVSLATVS